MIKALIIFLVSTSAFAVAIPLTSIDQIKMGTMISKIDSAYTHSEKSDGLEKKFYSYPKYDDKGFKIDCEADYYLDSTVPSNIKCETDVTYVDDRYDEVLVEVTDKAIAKNLYEAIPYGKETKKVYSGERVYGRGRDGRNQNIFRFVFVCTEVKCELTFATK